jgi:hypothetical protein
MYWYSEVLKMSNCKLIYKPLKVLNLTILLYILCHVSIIIRLLSWVVVWLGTTVGSEFYKPSVDLCICDDIFSKVAIKDWEDRQEE